MKALKKKKIYDNGGILDRLKGKKKKTQNTTSVAPEGYTLYKDYDEQPSPSQYKILKGKTGVGMSDTKLTKTSDGKFHLYYKTK